MSDPISTMAAITGEAAVLKTTVDTVTYNPNSGTSWAAGSDATTDLVGFTETKKMLEGMGSKASGGFTFPATSKPTHLQAKKSRLLWTGVEYTVLGYRERRFMGVINGYTLFFER